MITRKRNSSSMSLQIQQKPQILAMECRARVPDPPSRPADYRLGPIDCMSGLLASALAACCQENPISGRIAIFAVKSTADSEGFEIDPD